MIWPTVTASDIIAFIAVIGTIIATVSNNRASRSEIILDERLKAFQAIYSAFSECNNAYKRYDSFVKIIIPKRLNDIEGLNQYETMLKQSYGNSIKNFTKVYYDNRIFITKNIDTLIISYMKDIFESKLGFEYVGASRIDSEVVAVRNPDTLEALERYEHRITEAMHKFIGFK
jgi:hypothetical protein